LPLFRCLTNSNNEITEITNNPIIIQVKVIAKSELVIDEVGPMVVSGSIGEGDSDTEESPNVIV